MKATKAALFALIKQRFGVPPGPLIAIWGMETGFGANTGNTISAVATLVYDCRRAAYFTDHLYAALKLVDRGVLSASTRGAMHGEVGASLRGSYFEPTDGPHENSSYSFDRGKPSVDGSA
jgi:membrane-bound lytic murein transglycosylase B